MAVLAAIDTGSPTQPHTNTEADWSYWLWLAFGYGLTVLVAWWWDKRSEPKQAGWVQLSVDTMLAAVVVQLTGGISSEFALLYLVAIAASASHGSPQQCWGSMGACALTYTTLGGLELLDWIDTTPSAGPELSLNSKILTMARHLGAMLAITLFAARLTRMWQEAQNARLVAEKRQAQGRSKILELQKDLEHSERMAAIGQLAATVAHEIRNPLASMSGCVELLGEELEINERARVLEIIDREIKRLNTTVQQLLDYARPGAPQKTENHLAEVVCEVIEAFSQDPQRINLNIVQTGSTRVRGTFERESIAQLLWNLLHNAAHAQQNRGKIEVRVGEVEDLVELMVIDEGCGIDPEQSTRLFEPYYTTKAQGSGFGLAVVAKIVERHQGDIEIIPQERGSCFRIRWPKSPCARLNAPERIAA